MSDRLNQQDSKKHEKAKLEQLLNEMRHAVSNDKQQSVTISEFENWTRDWLIEKFISTC